ncbi:Crp/Fnr family transcriptional regulator [Robertkochia sediminum]|uniref:Crp/Fnr family transcriptional regulator n=1 Tax=Robertkochia sediminum TaxID=2785326 RepID=UPI0019342B3D|nr:Crp/Fnr family transcriptional regulator [Robertkochia sediminum]MBL7471563.1 Crp/Fnr family transcriptional regulator [Robertkochia sediminum]
MSQTETVKSKLFDTYSELLEKNLLEEMLEVGMPRTIQEGELLIDIGDELTHIPLILDGVVKIIRKDKHGCELSIYYLEPGDTCSISFANCINKKTSIFKGLAETEVHVLAIPVDLIDDWLVKYKSWRHFIIDSYHFRLLEMVETVDSLAFLKMEQRIWKYLTDKVKISNEVDLELTHQQIAEDLNSTRVVITRILKKLHEEEKIYSTRNRVRVLEFFE